jgi:hypothetical protein
VKYKVSGKDWRRPDLYQAVVFAAGAGTVHAAIVGFAAAHDASYRVPPANGTGQPVRLRTYVDALHANGS